nr:conserved hypothetical protein [Hymenolepis microstoma]
MILYVALVCCGLSILFGVFDKRQSKFVVLSLVLVVFICWVLITQLGVVGINIDLEKKQTEIRGFDTWLMETKFSELSWSYGLAAFALFFVLIALNILVWGPGGRLIEQAWQWPGTNDLPCCLAGSTTYRRMAMQENLKFNNQGSHFQRHQAYSPFSPSPMELIAEQHNNVSAGGVTDITSLDVLTYYPGSADSFNNDARSSSALPAESRDNLIESLIEKNEAEGEYSSQAQDPRTTVDLNFSRVSNRMSGVRSLDTSQQHHTRSDNVLLFYYLDFERARMMVFLAFKIFTARSISLFRERMKLNGFQRFNLLTSIFSIAYFTSMPIYQ